MDISGPLLTALIASLANSDHGWRASAAVQDPATSPTLVTVSLMTSKLRVAVGSNVPLQLAYMATLSGGALVDAKIIMNGVQYRSTSATLHTAIMALANAYLCAQDTALTASIVYGPQ